MPEELYRLSRSDREGTLSESGRARRGSDLVEGRSQTVPVALAAGLWRLAQS